ncbi:hypothetical protein [Microvirga tunisiensis]|uniref:Uncharacterized protein n=1 Tax=Microvirga tunisiensis TaxID=2108360 RepID=A0A5N7MWW5_9HYPH|nr:hypothetical protein [Microvirga tunisiensis]MPR12638.1 hypothetical protein [Microvirga tunisiensis]MPR30584.1 hypothetical protein [Microvirga tunisiensis]
MTEPKSSKEKFTEKLTSMDLKAATGAEDGDLQHELIRQAVSAIYPPSSLQEGETMTRASACVTALAALKPQDETEGMLAVQMISVHNAALECLRQAVARGTPEGQDLSLRQASKLMTVFLRQMEALDRHRGKGAPAVNVEHVHVEAGAQAVVGTLKATPPQERKRARRASPSPALAHQPVIQLDLERRPTSSVGADERLKRYPVEATVNTKVGSHG